MIVSDGGEHGAAAYSLSLVDHIMNHRSRTGHPAHDQRLNVHPTHLNEPSILLALHTPILSLDLQPQNNVLLIRHHPDPRAGPRAQRKHPKRSQRRQCRRRSESGLSFFFPLATYLISRSVQSPRRQSDLTFIIPSPHRSGLSLSPSSRSVDPPGVHQPNACASAYALLTYPLSIGSLRPTSWPSIKLVIVILARTTSKNFLTRPKRFAQSCCRWQSPSIRRLTSHLSHSFLVASSMPEP